MLKYKFICPTPFLLVDGWPIDQLPPVRFLDCLLPKPILMSLSFSSGVSDMHRAHHDSTETADTILGMVNHLPIKMIYKFQFSIQSLPREDVSEIYEKINLFIDLGKKGTLFIYLT